MSVLHVVFRVGNADYVLPALEVLHMEAFEGATAVPGTPPYVAGLVQVRGRVVPVVDLRVRFGLEPQPPTLGSRIVVVQQGERTVGLLVDSSREVLKIPPEQFRAPPSVLVEQSRGYVRQVAQVGTRLVMLLNVEKVLGQELSHG